jgi:hypothetical protein
MSTNINNAVLSFKQGSFIPILNSKVYISGPITGIKDLNSKAFSEMTEKLISRLYIPVNPLEFFTLEEQKTLTWEKAMRSDIKELLNCDACIMLPGWENSVGASFEFITAKTLNIPVLNTDFELLNTDATRLKTLFEKIITQIDAFDTHRNWFLENM